MNESTNLAICDLMAENGNLKQLLVDIMPEMKAHIEGLTKLWPGRETLTALHRNESLMKRIESATKN